MPTHTISLPYQRILKRMLDRLLEYPEMEGFRLLLDGTVLFESGTRSGELMERPFSAFQLELYGQPGCMTPALERQVKSMRKLADVLRHGLASTATMRASFLIDSYMEILALLEERIGLLNFYEKILHLNSRILEADDLFSVLQIIMDMSCEACQGEGSSLLLVDKKTGEMYFNVVSGDNESELREIRIPSGQGIAGAVVQNAKPEIIPDVSADPRSFGRVDQVLKHTTLNMIVAPIIARGIVIGVLEVINSQRVNGFISDDLEFLTNIASHTSLFIENIRSKEDLIRTNQNLDRKNSEINTLYEIGRVLNSSLDPWTLKKKLLASLLRIMRIRSGAILEPEGRDLQRTYALHNSDDGSELKELSGNHRFCESSDILLWLKEHEEPFSFTGSAADDLQGLVTRFKNANARVLQVSDEPDLWIPVLDDENQILFIIALGGINLRRRDPISDLKFFKGVMNACFAAFRNVQSYRQAIAASKREQHLRLAFQKYVPARVVADLVEESEPRPTRQEVSVLFADIRNFTGITENMEAYHMVRLLNEYFEVLVEIVAEFGGIIDKFMGDSVMAVFGLPETAADDAKRALASTFKMHQRLAELNQRRVQANEPEFQMGLGLHTGPVIVGNIGSLSRVDFTIIGDTVNLAARLERAVKFYGLRTLFTESTRKAAGHPACREVDLVQVRGRGQVVHLFEPTDWQNSGQDPNTSRTLWAEAIKQYRQGSFSQARQNFAHLQNESYNDPLLTLYLQRCTAFQENPPPENWDGIFQLDV